MDAAAQLCVSPHLYPSNGIFRYSKDNPQSACQSRSSLTGKQVSWTGKGYCFRSIAPKFCVTIACSMGASFDGRAEEMPGPPAVFSRINVRDPYKRLGISREASEEEIQEARNFLVSEYAGHAKSRESIEEAYDKIIMESFQARRKSKTSLKTSLKKKYAESPPWVRNLGNRFEVPSSKVILQRAVFFALLALWSIINPAEGGPAFQVAVSLAGCIYFLNKRLKSVWKSLIFGFGGLVVGWIFGSVLVPFLPPFLFPRNWSLELISALVSYLFLWFTCTYLK